MSSLVEAYINNPSLMGILAANNYFFHENSRDDILTLCEAKHNTRLVRFDWIINTWHNCLPFCEQNSTSQLERTLWWNKLHGGWPAGTNRNGNFKSKASQSGFINLQSTSAWGRLNIKMSFYQYMIPIIKIRLRPSYLYNGISYLERPTLYWDGAQVSSAWNMSCPSKRKWNQVHGFTAQNIADTMHSNCVDVLELCTIISYFLW